MPSIWTFTLLSSEIRARKSHSVWRHTHIVCWLVYCPPQQVTYIEIVIIVLKNVTSPKPGDQGSHTHPFGILHFSNTCLYLRLPFFMWDVLCKWKLAYVCKFGYRALARSMNSPYGSRVFCPFLYFEFSGAEVIAFLGVRREGGEPSSLLLGHFLPMN